MLAALASCGSESELDAEPTAMTSELCDITAESCQRAVLAAVAAERGEPLPPLPSIRIIDRTGVLYPPRYDLSAPPNPDGVWWSWDSAFAALHLLPDNKSSREAEAQQLTSDFGAHYSITDKQITLTKTSSALPLEQRPAMATLAHEFDHYMQDLAVDLSSLYAQHNQNLDERSATNALIEGEATVVGWRVRARLFGLSPDTLDWNREFGNQQGAYLDYMRVSSVPLTAAATRLPYAIGGRYIAKLWADYGRMAVDALFDDFPVSVVDWFAESDHGVAAKSVVENIDCPAPPPPDGFTMQGTTSVGVIGASAILATADSAYGILASGLHADRMTIYTGPLDDQSPMGWASTHVLVVWQLLFASNDAARNFSLGVAPLGLRQDWAGRQVVIRASARPELDPPTALTLPDCRGTGGR
jgi:hypothetical protein